MKRSEIMQHVKGKREQMMNVVWMEGICLRQFGSEIGLFSSIRGHIVLHLDCVKVHAVCLQEQDFCSLHSKVKMFYPSTF